MSDSSRECLCPEDWYLLSFQTSAPDAVLTIVIDGKNQNSILALMARFGQNLDSSSSTIGKWYSPKTLEFWHFSPSRNFPDDKYGVICEKFIKKVGKLRQASQLTHMADWKHEDVYASTYMS